MNLEKRHLELIDGYCSGSLSDKEFAELEEALRKDAALRRELLESRMLESELREYAALLERQPLGDNEDAAAKVYTIRRLKIEVWAMAAAIAVLVGGVAFLALRPGDRGEVAVASPELDPGVAVLTRAIDASWENRSVCTGDSMPPGRWKLLSGMAEFQFYNGASVILEAPADLEIVSENGGVLHAGKLRADVPHHAHGFTIATETVELVDLGTSFGMEVSSDFDTEVHVFDGKVELFDVGSEKLPGEGRELQGGEGLLLPMSGETSPISADASRFLDPSRFEKGARARYERWKSSAEKWKSHSHLVARYDFETDPGPLRVLPNRSSRRDDGLRGSIIGANWSSGRWPDKGALDFKRPGDRVRIEVPRPAKSVTLIAWLRIDGLEKGFQSILLSDGWDRPGAFHWQIHRDGYLELGVWHGDQNVTPNSQAIFDMQPADFGRWMQLAVVYDGENKSVTHYRDGEVLGEVPLPVVVPITIGKAEIGNWSPPPQDARQIRQFNGRIDEMLIFDVALNPTEIGAAYENGKP